MHIASGEGKPTKNVTLAGGFARKFIKPKNGIPNQNGRGNFIWKSNHHFLVG